MKKLFPLSQANIHLLIPLLFTIHNLEEFFFFSPIPFPQNLTPLSSFLASVNKSVFTIALLLVTILGWLFWACSLKYKWTEFLLYILQATIFINIFSHFGTVLRVGHYQMGLFTVLFINLPFSIFLFTRAFKAGWISKKEIAPIFIGAIIFHGPLLFGLLFLSIQIHGLF